jgi:hypothetical protein
MSKKKNRLGNSVDVIGGIADILNNEAKKKKNQDEEENTDEEKENNSSENDESKNDVKYSTNKKETEYEISQNTKLNDSNNDSLEDSWFDEQEPYRSSFIVKPKMETNFEDCKRKFRRELRMNLSKQNAIELGWLLLKKLKDSDFEKVRKTSSPDDDLVEALKEVIEEYY